MNDKKRLIDLKELSQILGRSENSLRYHMKMGRIRPTARFGRSYSFDPDEVLRQLQRSIKDR